MSAIPLSSAAGRSAPGRPALPAPVNRQAWSVRASSPGAHALLPTRRYEFSWLDTEGEVMELSRVAPALPSFEAAFSALVRGSLVMTTLGLVAVEDLVPGMLLVTRTGAKPLRWIGRILLPPANRKQDSGPDIYRIGAETFGHLRPQHDLLLCSGARILHRSGRLASMRTGPDALVPIGDFADGVQIAPINPMSALTVYHLATDHHELIDVNGLTLETFHPGREVSDGLGGDLYRVFMSFFPYLRDLTDFGGLACPRLGLEAIEAALASQASQAYA